MKKAAQPEEEEKSGVAAVERAMAILQAFSQGEKSTSLAELAHRTSLYKSTILRILVSLERYELVRRSAEGQYSLGPAIARLNMVYTSAFSLSDAAMPVLRELAAKTGECAALYVRQGDKRLCLYRVDSTHILRDQTKVGDLLPLDKGGGRLVRAYTGGSSRGDREIRNGQILITKGELIPELAGISCPVFDKDGRFLGAINLSVPIYRFDDDHAAAVREAAVKMTTSLGGTYPDPKI